MMKRFSRFLLCAALAGFVGGCSSSSNEPGGANDLTATWTMTATSTVDSGFVFDGSAALTQNGTNVTGTLTCSSQSTNGCGNFPSTGEAVTGTVPSGTSVELLA